MTAAPELPHQRILAGGELMGRRATDRHFDDDEAIAAMVRVRANLLLKAVLLSNIGIMVLVIVGWATVIQGQQASATSGDKRIAVECQTIVNLGKKPPEPCLDAGVRRYYTGP